MSMESVAAFWKEIDGNQEMSDRFFSEVPQKISSGAPIVAFAKQHGFEFSEDDLAKTAKEVAAAASGGELSEDQLQQVTGGVTLASTSLYSYPAGSTSLRTLMSFSSLYKSTVALPGGTVML